MSDEINKAGHFLNALEPDTTYRKALVQIAADLGAGPCSINTCDGCRYEMESASATVVRALGYENWAKFAEAELNIPDKV